MAATKGTPRVDALLLGGLVLIGLALRLPLLGDSLYGDELGSFYVSADHGPLEAVRVVASQQEVTPPLYFVLASLTAKLGDPTVTLRLVPLLCGIALIPGTYLLGGRLVGRAAGLAGAALITLSPFAIFYATEARAYSLATLLALLSTLALLRLVDTGDRRWAVAYAVLSLGVLYSHYTVAFVLLAQAAWAFVAHPRLRRTLIAANAGAALGFLPWFGQFLEDGRSLCSQVIDRFHPLDVATFFTDGARVVTGHPFLDLTGSLGPVPGGLALALLGAGLLLAAVAVAAQGLPARRRPAADLVLLVALAASPVLVALYSVLSDNSIYAGRNLLGALPALALVIGVLVVAVGSVPLRVAAALLLVAGLAIGDARSLSGDVRRPDYAAAARYVAQHADPSVPVVDALTFMGPGPYTPLDVELGRQGRPEQPKLNLGVPPRPYLFAEHARLGQRPCASQLAPSESTQQVLAEAAGTARDGRMLIVADRLGPDLGSKLPRELPAGYRIAAQRDLRGVGGQGLTVFDVVRR